MKMFGNKKKDDREQRSFLFRLLFLAFMAAVMLALLGVRTGFLTLVKGQELYDLSETKYVGKQKIPAPRGFILDTNGRVLARNVASYSILMSPMRMKEEEIASTLINLKRLCPKVNANALKDVMDLKKTWWRAVEIANDLALEEISALWERLPMLPGVRIERSFKRFYPYGRQAAFFTGSTGPITARDKKERIEEGYELNDRIGEKGLELAFETELRGEKGIQVVHRNARGRVMRTLPYAGKETRPGAILTLTIDMELQQASMGFLEATLKQLELEEGVIVAMDPRNGEVLAIASYPNYDPNDRSTFGPPNSTYDRALRGNYPPGSTFKPITAAAWLINNPGHLDTNVNCEHEYQSGDTTLKCLGWHTDNPNDPNETNDMRNALAKSCNIYFYTLAASLSTPAFVDVALSFGFGQSTGIGLPERSGILGSSDPASEKIDRILMGIGQGGGIETTPIQMAVAYSTIANGGTRYGARIIKSIQYPGQPSPTFFRSEPVDQVKWSPAQRESVLKGMRAVVESPYGTARHAQFDPAMKVAGKTGTATKAGQEPIAWFSCFAPWDKPEICVSVMIVEGDHGGVVASPVARQVLEKYYEIKNRTAKPTTKLPKIPLISE